MSNKTQKIFVKIICVVLALLMVGSVLTIALSVGAGAASQSALDKLKNEANELKQRKNEIKSEINSLNADKTDAINQKKLLDDKIEVTEEIIENLDAQIVEFGNLINEKELEVQQRQAAENEQWDKYKVRVRAMEENGVISYYAIIFGANSFADMLARIDMISSIMDYDEQVYQQLVSARQATEGAKASLEETKSNMEGTRGEYAEAERTLEEELAEAEALIEQITADMEQAQELYDQVAAEQTEVQNKILKMEEELRRQNSRVVGTGTFKWPADSNVVTSGFGSRNTGIAGASTNHKGLDIKAGYGANIYAADSGTVLVSEKNSSYGNYITISHGNGYTTLYGHMSKRLVKAGDTVKKGQVIGYAGATGIANGPHLHFEIWKNGNKINPGQFFTGLVYR